MVILASLVPLRRSLKLPYSEVQSLKLLHVERSRIVQELATVDYEKVVSGEVERMGVPEKNQYRLYRFECHAITCHLVAFRFKTAHMSANLRP